MMTFLCTGLDVFGRGFAGSKESGRLQDDIDSELTPRQLGWITLRQHPNAVAIHDHVIAIDLHCPWETAVGRIVAGEVGVGVGVPKVVDRYDVDVAAPVILIEGSQHVPPDTTVAVDSNLDCHCNLLNVFKGLREFLGRRRRPARR